MTNQNGAALLLKQVEKLGSFRAVAQALGVGVSDVHHWCKSGRTPKLEHAAAIEKRFKIKMGSWLVQNDTE